MPLLILVSLVWAFSFGLIKGRLTGLDPVAVSVVRLTLATLVFLPFLRWRGFNLRTWSAAVAIGAVQFGLMYVFLLQAFGYLQAYEVALFTIFTPVYITLLDTLLERRLILRHLVAAALAVVGAGTVLWAGGLTDDIVRGFLLMQASNLCFALGQIAYRRLRPHTSALSDAGLFAWLYLGALVAAFLWSAGATDWSGFRPTAAQWWTLVYLGILASGLCFFAWNVGALKVNAGTLAVFNNLKIPLGIAVSLVVFGESTDVLKLVLSFSLLAVAVWLTERRGLERGSRPRR
jgi:drug/metabolite transporter (DMT)-like permease